VAVAAVFALLCPAPGVGADAHAATTRPNIVVILTDDQPAQTMWAMPRTQRLLGAHGVKFTSYYDSVSLCCPARAAILTGRYAHSTHVYNNAPPFGGSFTFRHRGDDAQTLAVWLHRAGYHTGLFGKYPERLPGRLRPAGLGHVHDVGALLGRARL
jgi:N-acetylglucosamine-6-sulfatase